MNDEKEFHKKQLAVLEELVASDIFENYQLMEISFYGSGNYRIYRQKMKALIDSYPHSYFLSSRLSDKLTTPKSAYKIKLDIVYLKKLLKETE